MRRFPAHVKRRLLRVIDDLGEEPWPENLDVQPLRTFRPWLRVRDGDYRLFLRPLDRQERVELEMQDPTQAAYLLSRVVDKKHADRTIRGLSGR